MSRSKSVVGVRAAAVVGLLVGLGACAAPMDEEVSVTDGALTAGSGCYNTARGSALRMRDDDSRQVAIPFPVEFYGTSYTDLWVNSNGNVTLNGANPNSTTTTVPDGSLALIAPLYGNFDPGANRSSDVFFNTVGTAPDRQLLVTWYIAPEAGSTSPNTFQLQIHESGAIIFTYDSLTTDGVNPDASDMNVGISSGMGQHTLVASGTAIPAYAGAAVRFDWDGSDYGVVDGCDAPPPPPANLPPTADAGADQVLECTGGSAALASLDGSGSSDPDGDALSFDWSEGGSSIASGETADVSLGLGNHTITLTVDDGEFSDADSVDVAVEDTTAPSIDLTVDATDLWPTRKMTRVVSSISAADLCCNASVDITVSGEDDDHEIVGNNDGTFDVLVRATQGWTERDGRVYTITMESTDCAGNTTSEVVEVTIKRTHDNLMAWLHDLLDKLRGHFGGGGHGPGGLF